MNFLKHKKQIPINWLVALSIAFLFGIFFFGLKPNGFNFSNGVHWITDQSGIRFGKYGIAYTNPFIEYTGEDTSEPNGFSIEIAIMPASYRKTGFNIIFAIQSGKESDNLFLAQVYSRIYLVSGDDYDIKRKTKRIRVKLDSPSPTVQFITITTGQKGSAVYLNGRLVRTNKELTLRIPNGSKAGILIGNSVYGKHSWQGDVYGLAFYGYTLTTLDIKLHFNRWFQERNFSFAKNDKPLALYLFDEKGGVRTIDRAGGNHHLEIPSRMKTFKKKILSPSWPISKSYRGFYEDNIINLLGFIPFGFILAATFIKLGGTFEKYYLLITVSFCFMVSFFIEIVQAWIPSRSSDILDLILNTLGALIGATILNFFIVRIDRKIVLTARD